MTTLYITQPGSILKLNNRQFQVLHRQKSQKNLLISQTSQIVIIGICHISRRATYCIESRSIPVLFFSPQGNEVGRLDPAYQPAAYRQMQQQRFSEDGELSRQLAEALIGAQLHHQILLLSALNPSCNHLKTTYSLLNLLAEDLSNAATLEELQEYHATANSFYRSAALAELSGGIASLKHHWGIGLSINPALPLQWLFHLGTHLLHQSLVLSLSDLELDLEMGGFLHPPQDYRASLAWDLMTPFVPLIVDVWVVQLVHSQSLTADDFTPQNGEGNGLLSVSAMNRALSQWEQHLQHRVDLPQWGEVSTRQALSIQAKLYLSCILEDMAPQSLMFSHLPSLSPMAQPIPLTPLIP